MRNLSILFWLLSCLAAPFAQAGETPTYTNADLERIAPFRGETGALSTPAFRPESPAAEARSTRARSGDAARQGEDYWRREAQRVREQQRRYDVQIEALGQKLETRRAQPGVRPYSDAQVRECERRIAELQRRRSALESDLDDRARRARALPGWLR